MKKLVVLSVLMTLVVMGLSAQTAEVVEKYWERGCGVDNTSDDVRNMAIWPAGDILATINRTSGSDAIQLFNATTGLMEEITEHLDMTGIPATTYSVVSGDFSDDGAFFACSLSYTTGVDLEVYYWANLTAAPVKILDQAYSTRLGDAFDATGQVSDNSITLLISGNTAGSVPVRVTYDGSTWTATTLANAVRAQDLDQVAGGKFYATYAGGDIVRYNADGSVDATVVSGADTQTSMAIDETRGLIYSMGYYSESTAVYTNYLKVYDETTGNLLADMSSDPVDVLGNFSETANGSSAVEIVEQAGGTYIYALSERNGCARYSYSTLLTVAASGADFTTIQGAISSYCAGGANAGAVKPLLIAIDPASGPYDEALCLDQIQSGTGDIAGDIVLKATGGAKAIVKLQEGDVAEDDGLMIVQDTANVILKDLVFCASVSAATFTDDLIHVEESASNATENWVEFYGCILTAIDDSGEPMITSAADALNPPATYNSQFADGDALFRFQTTAGYSRSLFMEQSVIYASQHLNYLYLHGTTGSQARLHNTVISYARASGLFPNSYDGRHYLTITGDDQSDGILTGDIINCSAIYDFNSRLFYDYAAGIHARNCSSKLVLVVKNAIIYTPNDHSQSRGISTYYDGTGSARWTDIFKIHDVIIDVPNTYGIIDQASNDMDVITDIQRTTFKTADRGMTFAYDCPTSYSLTDCVFSDCSVAVRKSSGTDINVNLINCGLPEVGAHAITSVTYGSVAATIVNSVTADPDFVSIDPSTADYLDVMSIDYLNAASDGTNLSGGGSWAGTEIRDWTAY